jgi:hypothetical protein
VKKTYLNQLNRLEENYQKEQQQIEATLEAVFSEKQQFRRELEGLAENYRYHYKQAEFDEPINMNRVYYQLEQCQDKGNQLVNKTINKLEEQKEESKSRHQKETKQLEDKLTLLKEEEVENE